MLFKILQGDSSRISTDITPIHPGWCYFTSDDGKFYIDSQEEDGTQKRTCINPNNASSSRCVNRTLKSDSWVDGKQTLLIDGMSSEQNGFIGLAQGMSDSQVTSAQNALLSIDSQDNGTLVVSCLGDIPQIDIPVVIVLFATIVSA